MITDLKDLLSSIGYDDLTDNGSFWRTNALYRDGDNKTSLRINKRTGNFQDFVERRFGTIEELIKLTLGIEDTELKKFYEGNHVNLNELIEKDDKPKLTMEKTWNDDELSNLLPHYKFYEGRGISKETLKFFKSGFAHSGSMNQRFVFPIYNIDGRIHGWSGRDMTGKKEAKWKHMGKKGTWVYPAYMFIEDYKNNGTVAKRIYPVIEAIKMTRQVILVESIGDMLALWERGIYNVLVTFGLVLSPKLGAFLLSLEVDSVVVSLNNDFESSQNRGQEAAVCMFIDLMHYMDIHKLNIVLPKSNDFGCITDEQFEIWKVKKDKINTAIYKVILEELRRRYKNGTITKAENMFGKALSSHYEQQT